MTGDPPFNFHPLGCMCEVCQRPAAPFGVLTLTQPKAPDPDVLTVDQAANFLQIGRRQMYEAIGRGEVPHRRIGRIIRLSRAALVRWLEGSCEAASKKGGF